MSPVSPILDAAVEKGLLHVIPKWFEVIEHCHTLPNAKVEGKPPIIVRFQSRLLRYLTCYFHTLSSISCSASCWHQSCVHWPLRLRFCSCFGLLLAPVMCALAPTASFLFGGFLLHQSCVQQPILPCFLFWPLRSCSASLACSVNSNCMSLFGLLFF